MKTFSRFVMAGAILGLAGCGSLPESGLGGTFIAGPFIAEKIEGNTFNAALARAYQKNTLDEGTKIQNWYDASAYARKGYAAMEGKSVAPWAPEAVGLTGSELDGLYKKVTAALGTNSSRRPAECAALQASWDHYLEELSEGSHSCSDPNKIKAEVMSALTACNGAEPPVNHPTTGKSNRFTVYFGFNRSDITSQAREVISQVAKALKSYANPAISIVGHTDTVGSTKYNQKLSEKRANAIAKALATPKNRTTLAGRSELELAVPTADNVREPQNRRVEITISE